MRLRTFAAAGALLLAALGAFADNPSGRAETRMAFDPSSNQIILFGGATPQDSATKIIYDLDDTWTWTGTKWVRLATAHTPGPRSGHVMVTDSTRGRIVLFGGRRIDASAPNGTQIVLNDTWVFRNFDWTQLDTPNQPPARTVAGAAYDPVRDRVVLFGGNTISTDGKNTVNAIHDTWEFDGTTWVQRASDGPRVSKPTVFYDQARKETYMVGLDENSNSKTDTAMFRYDPAAGTWTSIKPEGLPDCVNEAQVTFDQSRNTTLLTGGVCASSDLADTTFEFNGEKWTKLEVKTTTDRIFGGGMAFDPVRQNTVLYGGTVAFGSISSNTVVFTAGDWVQIVDATSPAPRSLSAFWFDPHAATPLLYGGLDNDQGYFDLWSYANGTWIKNADDKNQPTSCVDPLTAYDTDRQRLVMICNSIDVWEFDGTTWTQKKASDQKTKPDPRRLSSIAYDQTLKKIVYFGGFNETNFLQETWLWDGTSWTRIKKNLPPYRAQAAMWYDQTLKKTVIYGGVGRTDTEGRIVRFSDMWAFDGSGWTELHPSATPGQRYSTTYAVDPRDGHVLLFGGILYNKDEKTEVETQRYMNDLWEWDGANWKQLQATNPPARENASLVFNPLTNKFVMFGGYAARYFGDVWTLDRDTLTWQTRLESPTGARRRAGR
jgi:hypothetical protein